MSNLVSKFSYTSSAGQNLFAYPEQYHYQYEDVVEVYVEGSKLIEGRDYQKDSSSVILTTPLPSGKNVELVLFNYYNKDSRVITSDNPSQTPSGLYRVYLGDFDEDPDADTVFEFSEKFNVNTEILDPLVPKTRELDVNMFSIKTKGLLDGCLNGGRY